MGEAGWLSHPLACLNRAYGPGQSLVRALRSTRTYQAFAAGQTPPAFNEQVAIPAVLDYTRRRGRRGPKYVQKDRVLVDRSAGLLMHIHSEHGRRTIAFLDDVPPQHIALLSGDSARIQPPQPSDELLPSLTEGQQSFVTLTVYERNPIARQRCIEHYGTSCSVCAFSFGRVYGDSFADYIHVHHLMPVSVHETEYEIEPVRDLRPVCPNCHAIIHARRPPFTIEELRRLIQLAPERT